MNGQTKGMFPDLGAMLGLLPRGALLLLAGAKSAGVRTSSAL